MTKYTHVCRTGWLNSLRFGFPGSQFSTQIISFVRYERGSYNNRLGQEHTWYFVRSVLHTPVSNIKVTSTGIRALFVADGSAIVSRFGVDKEMRIGMNDRRRMRIVRGKDTGDMLR